MNQSETHHGQSDTGASDPALELTDEQQEALNARLDDMRAQLEQIEGEREAIVAGLDELREEFGAQATDSAAATRGIDASGEPLKAQLTKAEEERLALLAEMANVRRRSAQNEQQARTQGQRTAVQNLLGVLDHFDLTLGHVNPETSSASQVLDGVKMIREEMIRVLGTMGVEVLTPSAGDAFEPGRHQAIAQQPSGEVEPGSVLHVARAGYAIEGQIIRPAEVVVASDAGEQPASEE